MDAQDLRTLLEKTSDKLSIFANRETLHQYNFNENELISLINDFLKDEQKYKLFEYPHFLSLQNSIKQGIFEIIKDENIKLQIIMNDDIADFLSDDQLVEILKNFSDDKKQQLLNNKDFIQKHKIGKYEIKSIILSFGDKAKVEILSEVDFMTNNLQMDDFRIAEIIESLSNQEDKEKIIKLYDLENTFKVDIIKTYSTERKLEIVLEENDFDKYNKIGILRSLDEETLSKFLVENKDFCSKNDIRPYEIVSNLENESQVNFIKKLKEMDLTLTEKREILALLKPEIKEKIDTSDLPEEYKTALSMQTKAFGTQIVVDLNQNFEDYRGLDNLIYVNPEKFTNEEKFLQLCDICPNLHVCSTLDKNSITEYMSTVSEYKESEEWIENLINNLDPKYTKAQKLAIIDNAIGKKISYSPDYGTEIFNEEDGIALYKIISSGYGICNGISRVEQYILNKVGIKSELVSGNNHVFLKIKDIELELGNGEIVKGNTILDPTWNLSNQRFGGIPNNFCISYETARKNDIDDDGKDHMCHRNDNDLQDATLELDEQGLRRLYTSVGLADKEGFFPIKDIIDESEKLHKIYAKQPNENVKNQFLLLSRVCPEFATCQNSSMGIIRNVLLNNENLEFNNCVVNRVYNRNDEAKKPVLFVYIDSNEIGKKFYFADKNKGQFIETSKEEFEKKFECYDRDLEKHNGIRPWEDKEQQTDSPELSNSSGKIISSEGEER